MKLEYEGRVLDFHIHPFEDREHNLCFFRETMDIRFETCLADMDRCGVRQFAGSVIPKANGFRPPFRQIRELNDEALRLRELSRGRYIPGIHIHPAYMQESLEELRRMQREDVRLVGELVPYLMGWNEFGYGSPQVQELMEAAGEAGMVVSMHSGTAEDMDALLEGCRKTAIVGAHPGNRESFAAHVQRMKDHANYYLDLCGSEGIFRKGLLQTAVREVGAGRVLYGTDYPICSPGATLAAVLLENLSPEEVDQVLYRNAASLLRM